MSRLTAAIICMMVSSLAVADRSALRIEPNDEYTITSFPLYGAAVTPSDSADLSEPGFIRADAAGAVTLLCYGSTTSIALNLAAGEYAPCLVKRVYDTGTDAITIHVFF